MRVEDLHLQKCGEGGRCRLVVRAVLSGSRGSRSLGGGGGGGRLGLVALGDNLGLLGLGGLLGLELLLRLPEARRGSR